MNLHSDLSRCPLRQTIDLPLPNRGYLYGLECQAVRRRQWIAHGSSPFTGSTLTFQDLHNRKVLVGSLYWGIYMLNVIWYIRVFRIARTQYTVYTNLNNDVHTGIQYQNHVNVILVLRERN